MPVPLMPLDLSGECLGIFFQPTSSTGIRNRATQRLISNSRYIDTQLPRRIQCTGIERE